jgi:hypothetical protein
MQAQVGTFTFMGNTYSVKRIGFRGWQDSPFNDRLTASENFMVTNVNTGEQITFSAMVPEYIRRYGFYEGRETSYRVDPAKIISMFFKTHGAAQPSAAPSTGSSAQPQVKVMTAAEIDAAIDQIPRNARPNLGFADPLADGNVGVLRVGSVHTQEVVNISHVIRFFAAVGKIYVERLDPSHAFLRRYIEISADFFITSRVINLAEFKFALMQQGHDYRPPSGMRSASPVIPGGRQPFNVDDAAGTLFRSSL